MTRSTPEHGQVWIADLDPVTPGEQGGLRPVLIVSVAWFNAWPVGLVMVAPLTSRDHGFNHHVPVTGGGLDRISYVMPEYVRSISQRRLKRDLGQVEPTTMAQVDTFLRRFLGID